MKEYRIFISSTFKDMQQERDAIRNEVFPELELFAKQLNIAISIVDLRWGINTEECETNNESSFKIFRTCFDEIDESKPFFVGLVGNRYGWIPDLNSLPLSLDSKFKDFLRFQGKSITESEMLYAIDTFEKDGLFVFAFRNNIVGELTPNEKETYLSSSQEDKKKIDDLKKRLKSNEIISYFDYDASINEGVLDLKYFVNEITSLIKEKISLTVKEDENKNTIDKILEEQASAIEINHSTFSGRENVFEKINNFYQSEDKYLAISGESGTGKSSLIQEEIYRKSKDPNINVVSFLLGSGEGSKDVRYALAAILYQVKKLNKHKFNERYLDINNVDDDYDSLVNSLSLEIAQLSKKKPVYIYLDALDQLIDTGKGLLSYLNTRYFALENINVKIVVTYIPKPAINDELKLKLFKVMEIPPLSESDVINITKKRLSREKKTLSSKGIKEILSKRNNNVMCASSPLYLSLLIQQIINLDYLDFAKIEKLKETKNDEDAIYEYIESLIRNAPDDLKGEMFNIIDSANKKIGKEFVYYALGIISMSRNGVREKDLNGIFNVLGIHYESTDFSYLRKMFRHFLSHQSSYLDFNHKIIDDLLEDYYFNTNKEDSTKVSLKTIEYLDTLDENDEFKINEYFYYCYKANNKDLFYKRLKTATILEPFYLLFEQEETSNVVSDFFSDISLLDDETITKLIDNAHYLNYLGRKKILLLLLDNKNISEHNRIRCLHYLALDEKNYGDSVSSDHLSKVMIKEAIKHNLYLNESLSLRGQILLDKYKYGELNRLLKKVKDKCDTQIYDEFKNRCDAVRKPKQLKSGYLSQDELIEMINNLSINELYEKRSLIEKNISKHIGISDKIIENLQVKESNSRDKALNSGVDEIVSYSYILYLIGMIYLAAKDKEKAKEYLLRGYDVINSIFELLEKKNDFILAGDFACYLNRLKSVKFKELLSKEKAMLKHGVNDISYGESKARNFAMSSVFIGVILVIFVFDLAINALAYLISYYSGIQANEYVINYFQATNELLIFIAMFTLFYFLLSFIFNKNHISKKAISDLIIVAISIFVIAFSAYAFNLMTSYDSDYQVSETKFAFLNSLTGAASISLVMYSVRNFNKKEISLENRIDIESLKGKRLLEILVLLLSTITFSIISGLQLLNEDSIIGKDLLKNSGIFMSYISIIGPIVVGIVGLVLFIVSLIIEERRANEK